jgi:hypothetical protein
MAELSRVTGDYLESFDRLHEELVRATRATEQLVGISAGRVLRRVRWSGEAAVAAAVISQELQYWQPQIEQQNFLPLGELHARLSGQLASFSQAKGPPSELFIERAIRRVSEAILDETLTAEQMAAVESARKLLETSAAENDRVLPAGLEQLPASCLAVVVTALFARLRDEVFTDNRSEWDLKTSLRP